jgi:uncharacterized membrane protein YidH (DUF202 family)
MEAFNAFITKVEDLLLTPLLELLAFAAFLLFVWGVFNYIRNGEDDTKRKEGRSHIIWGIVGLAIIFAANGIIHFLQNVADTTLK